MIRSADRMSLENQLDYEFKDKALLKQALTHGSMTANSIDNYQRLEFLGDRVLGLCIAEVLHHRFPDAHVGELAERLNYLVSSESCALVADSIDLNSYLLVSKEVRRSFRRGEKSLQADAMEAILAAVYLDGGWQSSCRVVLKLWKDRLSFKSGLTVNPKTKLQDFILGRDQTLPRYQVVDRIGPDHDPEFTVQVDTEHGERASATASSKREAEKLAARCLLEILEVGDD